jgi:hypothetical protein
MMSYEALDARPTEAYLMYVEEASEESNKVDRILGKL